jgi:hypothetical protein
MSAITLGGVAVYAYLVDDGSGIRVRVSADEAERLGLVLGQQVRVEAPGNGGTFLLTATDDAPPFVFLRLSPLASRIAG